MNMKIHNLLSILLIILVINIASMKPALSNPKGNMILYNGKIYTVNKDKLWAEAVIIEDGIITFVGSSKQVLKKVQNSKESTKYIKIDLEGNMALPGLHDVHNHVLEVSSPLSSSNGGCVLESFVSKAKLAKMLKDCTNNTDNNKTFRTNSAKISEIESEDTKWIIGSGFSLEDIMEKDFVPIEFFRQYNT